MNRNSVFGAGLFLRHWRATFAVILFTSILLSGALAYTKRPWCDEAWFASPAYNLVNHGSMRTTVLDPHGFAYTTDLKGIDHFTYWIMPGYALAQAAWYKIVPFSLFSMRSLSTLSSLVALLSWFVVMDWITHSRPLSLLAVFLLGTEQQFIRSAAFGRMDMLCFALGLSALATYVHFRESRFLLALGTSLALATASIFTHPNGLFYAMILIGLSGWLDAHRLRFRTVFVGVLPSFSILAGWALYVLQAPDLFAAQIHSQSSFLNSMGNPVRMVIAEIAQRYREPYGLTAPFPISLGSLVWWSYLLSFTLFLAAPSLRSNSRFRLLFLAVVFQFAGLLFVKKSWYYIIYILPFCTALLAVGLAWVFSKGRFWKFAACAAMLLITLINTGFILIRVYRRDMTQFEEAVSFLRANRKPGDLIVGSGELAFGLGFDGQVLDDCRLGYLSKKTPTFVVIEPQYSSYWFPWIQAHEPEAHAHIRATLKQYNLVYGQPLQERAHQLSAWSYQIYRRPMDSAERW